MKRIVAGCLALLLAGALAGWAQELKGPAKAALELAREAEAGKDVTKGVAALSKQLGGVGAAMRLFEPRSRGGVGVGAKGAGVERRLTDLAEDGLSAEALKEEAADLTRLAHLTAVVAEATHVFAPAKPFAGRGKKEWDRDLTAVKAGSRDLLKAVRDSDPKAARSAADRVNKACTSCHDGAR